MAARQVTKTLSLSDYSNALLGYLLGAYLLDFLVGGTALRTLGLFLDLLVAGIFLYLLPSMRDSDRSSGRPGRLIAEAITGAWSTAGVGALMVWIWFVDTKKVVHEGMSKAQGWNRLVFWCLIVVGLIIGGYSGLRRSGWTGLGGLARFRSNRDRGSINGD
jgi:hypothetical protein